MFDPEDFIYSYFANIINKIDLRREKLKEEVDLYSEELIHKLNMLKTNNLKESSTDLNSSESNDKNQIKLCGCESFEFAPAKLNIRDIFGVLVSHEVGSYKKHIKISTSN